MTDELSTADRLDLAQLTSLYAAAVDGRDWDALGTLFVADAVLVTADPPRSLHPGLEASGIDAIVAAARQLTAYARTFHHLTGSFWTPDGPSVALGRTTCAAHHVEAPDTSARSRSFVWHVIYADQAVRTDLGWRFARRELTVAMVEARPLSLVLPYDAPPST
ncbi:MAG: nuclear transport factor 2 family protein [Marmoricola sp.]|nr:nuclear transport factor 2 family protein [Marmoricola sp.]